MKCPKCQNDMESINYNSIEIDRCTHCFGIWFDQLEKEDLKHLKGAESIDIGDEFVGAKFDRIEQINCPKCNVPARHVEVVEPFIRFEQCPDCLGSFFDAGEFRDYMEDEILAQFRAVLPG